MVRAGERTLIDLEQRQSRIFESRLRDEATSRRVGRGVGLLAPRLINLITERRENGLISWLIVYVLTSSPATGIFISGASRTKWGDSKNG